MLHGNLLLNGWYLTDVSFYTTELPQYALLEIFFGVHANTAHIAAAMTYTLAVLLAVLVARGGFTSRAALIRMLIGPGSCSRRSWASASPPFSERGHIGTAVPVLLIFLLLDRAPRRWYVPVLTALGLAWALIADELVLVVGVAPLALVCALRVAETAVRERGLARGAAARRYELSLIGAAGAAAGLAWAAERVLRALGGYILHPIRFTFASHYSWATLHVLWAVPRIFGADYRGLAGGPYYTALLHWVSLALVGLALLLAAWRFFSGIALVDQVLAMAIVLNIVLFVTTGAGSQGPTRSPWSRRSARRWPRGCWPARRPPERVRRACWPAGRGSSRTGLAWLFCSATWEVWPTKWSSPPRRRTARRSRPGWKPITCGTGWAATGKAASSRSQTGGQVKVRAVLGTNTMGPYLWLAKPSWYDPAGQQANFVVLASTRSYLYWEPRAVIAKSFGRPAREYHVGPFTVMVWDRNLLSSIPRQPPRLSQPGRK